MAGRPNLSYGITLDEYLEWDATATRPLTDPPIGNPTRRRTDAQNSLLAPEPHHRTRTAEPEEATR